MLTIAMIRAFKKRAVESFDWDWRTLFYTLENPLFSRLYIFIVVVPILVNAVESFPANVQIDIPGLKTSIGLTPNIPTTWVVGYFGALSMLVARVIYLSFCPSFLRVFEHTGDAIQKGVTPQSVKSSLTAFLRKYGRSGRKLHGAEQDSLRRILKQWRAYNSEEEIRTDISDHRKVARILDRASTRESAENLGYYLFGGTEYASEVSIERNQFLRSVIINVENFLNETARNWRILTAILLAIGFSCFAFVFASSAYTVLDLYANGVQTIEVSKKGIEK